MTSVWLVGDHATLPMGKPNSLEVHDRYGSVAASQQRQYKVGS